MRRTRQWIEGVLRQRIRDGVYPPGSPMPTHRDLVRELGTSSATVQQAFDRLGVLGYVESRNRRGTVVAVRLPHQWRLALVLPHDSSDGANRFYATAKRVGEAWDDGGFTFRPYAMRGRTESAARRRLCADVADGALAGIVFIHPPYALADSPVMRAAIPRVTVEAAVDRDVALFGASVVAPVSGDIPERIARRFKAAGRRRMAGLLSSSDPSSASYLALLRAVGLETRPEWWPALPIDAVGAACARDVARLLVSGPPRSRPDCLLIADDHLVPHAIAGVLDAKLRVPIDIELAAHANFPTAGRLAAPCLQFGYDMRELLTAAIAEIRFLAAGGTPRLVRVAATLRPSD